MTRQNVNIFSAGLIVDYLIKHNIKLFCISPGSRSTPLAIAAFDHPDADTKMFYDERAAAYYALSHTRSSGDPSALICTSGTAVANYLPGVIEAFQSFLPIAILTADRPSELQDCGANQTIDQQNIFGKFVSSRILFEAPDKIIDPINMLNQLDAAFSNFTRPIHINCRFREPLAVDDAGFDASKYTPIVDNWYNSNNPQENDSSSAPSKPDMEEAVALIDRSQNGLIVAGPTVSFENYDAVVDLAKHLKWPIVADILSPLRIGTSKYLFSFHDLYFDNDESINLDAVIHVGGLPTPKRLNQFLLKHRAVPYIKIHSHAQTIDPDRLETMRLVGPPDRIIAHLLEETDDSKSTDWVQLWREREQVIAAALEDYFDRHDAIEPALAFSLPDLLSDGDALFLSNSMPVRDADSFTRLSGKDVVVGANRGVSGIDGIIASACGFASGCRRPTTLVIGDLAFLHDMNSLYLAARSKYPIRIIVINNDGGGIFHFLPIAELQNHFEPLFGTPHGLTFEKAAQQFDLPFRSVASTSQLKDSYHELCKQNGSFVVELQSNRSENHMMHQALRDMISEKLSDWTGRI